MRSLTPISVFVVAILISHTRSVAEDTPRVAPDWFHTASATTADDSCDCDYSGEYPAMDNGFDRYRQHPNSGSPCSPSAGFKHYPFGMHMFTAWHRPKSSTWTKSRRCEPQAYRPRGYGNLFARPRDCYRMDYTPHALQSSWSTYGPSYYGRAADQNCDHCAH